MTISLSNIILDGSTNRLVCKACNEFHQLHLPIEIKMLSKKGKHFNALHSRCVIVASNRFEFAYDPFAGAKANEPATDAKKPAAKQQATELTKVVMPDYVTAKELIKSNIPLALRRQASKFPKELTGKLREMGLPHPVTLLKRYKESGEFISFKDLFSFTATKTKKTVRKASPSKPDKSSPSGAKKPTREDMNRMFAKAGLGEPKQFEDPPSFDWIKDLITSLLEMKDRRGV